MEPDRRRHSRNRKSIPQTVRIVFEEPGHPRREIIGKLVDTSLGGFCVEVAGPLGVGSAALVDGQIVRAPKAGLWATRVTWCRFNAPGAYSAGLRLEHPAQPALNVGADGKQFLDCYDVLQLSTKADPDTIHRVYRMLAQRYHPDNPDTGCEETFKRLLQAYKVLSDPEQRAAYDVRHQLEHRVQWRIFHQPQAAQGREAQRSQRQGILTALYTRRINEPAQPSMSIHELEDLLGCPREHLEFSLWYLKEKGWIGRTDNGRYSICAAGVEQAEGFETSAARVERLLPSASNQA